MLSVVADVDDIVFDVEAALSQQLGTQPLPFPGMDSKLYLTFVFAVIIRNLWTPYPLTLGIP